MLPLEQCNADDRLCNNLCNLTKSFRVLKINFWLHTSTRLAVLAEVRDLTGTKKSCVPQCSTKVTASLQ